MPTYINSASLTYGDNIGWEEIVGASTIGAQTPNTANQMALHLMRRRRAYGTIVNGNTGVTGGIINGCNTCATSLTWTTTCGDTGAGFINTFTTILGLDPARRIPAPVASLNHKGTPMRSAYRSELFAKVSSAEIAALQLLRKMVSQEDFRRYLRHGFVPVRAKSGLVYQIDRQNRIMVWDRGEKVASLCVHVRGQSARAIPPTDEVIGKMLIVECDESDIWKRSNVAWEYPIRPDRPALLALGINTKPTRNTFIIGEQARLVARFDHALDQGMIIALAAHL